MAERASHLSPARILETAAGTGIVTRALSRVVPDAEIAATDLTPAVVAFAQQSPWPEQVTFRTADAQELPFPESSFDLVVCQFGVMFMPDKARRTAF